MKRIGIYPGTFDPMTFGHVDIIKRAIALVDHLIVAVAVDIDKAPLFLPELRTKMVKKEVGMMGCDKITVSQFSGLLVNFAAENNAAVIIRGLRAVSDFEYEFKMSWVNRKLNNEIEMIFLPASKDTQFISSNFVKEVARLGGDISQFVPGHVIQEFNNIR